MDIATTIYSIAKTVGVSGSLLLAICQHESGNFKQNYAAHDRGSPSFGVCQIKYFSALQLGFKGRPIELMDLKTNVTFAARYLKYQQDRYGDKDWVLLVASYNAGTYRPSKKVRGCPRNLRYVRLVQSHLPTELQSRLSCGN